MPLRPCKERQSHKTAWSSGKNTGFGIGRPKLKSLLCHLLVMQLWASHHFFQSQIPHQYSISEGYEDQMIYVKYGKALHKLYGEAIGKFSQMKNFFNENGRS